MCRIKSKIKKNVDVHTYRKLNKQRRRALTCATDMDTIFSITRSHIVLSVKKKIKKKLYVLNNILVYARTENFMKMYF